MKLPADYYRTRDLVMSVVKSLSKPNTKLGTISGSAAVWHWKTYSHINHSHTGIRVLDDKLQLVSINSDGSYTILETEINTTQWKEIHNG